MSGRIEEVSVTLPALHPGQLSVMAGARRFNVLCCGRRFGKTTLGESIAAEALLEGKRVGWFAPTYKLITEVWENLKRMLHPLIAHKDETDMRLELIGGGIFECWTLDKPDPARGRKYHVVLVDEAGLVRDLLGVFFAAIRPTLTDYKGGAWLFGTPKGRKHGFAHLLAKGLSNADPGWAGFQRGTIHNPFIDPEEIEDARRSMPESLYLQEYEGIPMDDGSHPIGYDAIASVQEDASTRPVSCWGIDLARSTDFTVLVGLDIMGRWVTTHRWQAPWSETKRRILEICGTVTPCTVDATGVGDGIVDDLQRNGLNASRFIFTAPSKRALMERLISAIHNRHISIPPIEHNAGGFIKAELDALEVNMTERGPKYGAPPGLHDDGVMALGLAVRALDALPLPDWPIHRATEGVLWEGGKDDAKLRTVADEREVDEWLDAEFGALGNGW